MAMLSLKRAVIVLIAMIVIVMLAWLLTRQSEVSSVSITTLSGEKIRLQKLRGKIVLVTFWATSCPACIKEMPDLIQTYRKYHERGFEIIAVAMSYDSLQYVKAFTTKNKLPFSVVWDADGKLAQSFNGVRLTPTAFLIGKDGNLISQTIGIIDFSKFHAVLNSALLE